MLLGPADVLEIEREACKRSLSTFVREAWPVLEPGQPYVHGWHIDVVCEHLQAVTDGEITRLLINVPPGTMKSTLVNVLWPAWEWGPRNVPTMRFIGASHEQGLAIRDNLKMRRLVTSDWYRRRWAIDLTGDQNQKTYYENDATGFRQACAVTSMTGRRGDRVAWDDPHSTEGALSDAARETSIRVFQETLPTRLNNPDSSAIIVVMQRLHQDDVSGFILAGDYGYTHLCLPMEYDSKHPHRYTRDPRKKDGDLLFPERFPREVVERDKKIMGTAATAGQFQQLPAPRGGGIFKNEWWRYYDVLPRIKYRAIYADTAQKAKEKNDYTVFQCWGAVDGGGAALIDQVRGKWESPEMLVQARAFWNKHKTFSGAGRLRAFRVEDKVSGTGLIQTLKREGIPMQGIPRNANSGDKVTRAMDVAPSVESGLVWLPRNAPWLSDYTGELSIFPNGSNDDQVDPTSDAISEIILGKGGYRWDGLT